MSAVEVGTSCFGGMCTGQVRIRTNFRPSSLVLENLAFLESNSLDYSQLCILEQGEMASGDNKTPTICFFAVTDRSFM